VFVTSQGTASGRFRRAIDRRLVDEAMFAAAEMPKLPLGLALELVELLAEASDPRFDRAAARWLLKLAAAGADLRELQLAGAALNRLEADPACEIARETLARLAER
jgi:hypothetical protein